MVPVLQIITFKLGEDESIFKLTQLYAYMRPFNIKLFCSRQVNIYRSKLPEPHHDDSAVIVRREHYLNLLYCVELISGNEFYITVMC